MSTNPDPNAPLDRPVNQDESRDASAAHADDPLSTIDRSTDPASTGGCRPEGGTITGDLPTVPGYRVVREIARGGMGRVLAAGWKAKLPKPTAPPPREKK